MVSDRAIYAFASAWSFGWGVLALLRPPTFYRVISSGRQKKVTPIQFTVARILGVLSILLGFALLMEIVLGRIPAS